MFKRIALNYLREWAKKDERKPLVLRGARQVGKTTLVRMFAEEFSNYIYLNPVSTVIFSALVLDEPMTGLAYIGSA